MSTVINLPPDQSGAAGMGNALGLGLQKMVQTGIQKSMFDKQMQQQADLLSKKLESEMTKLEKQIESQRELQDIIGEQRMKLGELTTGSGEKIAGIGADASKYGSDKGADATKAAAGIRAGASKYAADKSAEVSVRGQDIGVDKFANQLMTTEKIARESNQVQLRVAAMANKHREALASIAGEKDKDKQILGLIKWLGEVTYGTTNQSDLELYNLIFQSSADAMGIQMPPLKYDTGAAFLGGKLVPATPQNKGLAPNTKSTADKYRLPGS